MDPGDDDDDDAGSSGGGGDGSDKEDIFHGVLPLDSERNNAPSKKRKTESGDSGDGTAAGDSLTTFLYGSIGHRPTPRFEVTDPAAEQAMMRAMGLPTALRAMTADVNGDAYEVWASDPSSNAAAIALQNDEGHEERQVARPSLRHRAQREDGGSSMK